MEMKKKKKFVVPGVLQVCEVALEGNLLGASQEQTLTNTDVQRSVGHETEAVGTYVNSPWLD